MTSPVTSDAILILVRFPAPDPLLYRMRTALPGARFVVCTDGTSLDAHRGEAVVLLGGMDIPGGLDAWPKLRWVQTLAAGIDGFDLAAIAARGVTLTNGRGVNVANLAEHAMAMLLSIARGVPDYVRRQERREWLTQDRRPSIFELGGQTLAILGYGALGQAVATRAQAFDMTIAAIRRSGTGAADAQGVVMQPPAAMVDVLGGADHVLLTMPLTPATRHIIDASRIAQMKPGSYLHNIGRGALVDQAALIAALESGHLAGAALDVTDPEPLPPESPLWGMANVLITGHSAGNTPRFFGRMMDLVVDNLARYGREGDLRNRVDLDHGY